MRSNKRSSYQKWCKTPGGITGELRKDILVCHARVCSATPDEPWTLTGVPSLYGGRPCSGMIRAIFNLLAAFRF